VAAATELSTSALNDERDALRAEVSVLEQGYAELRHQSERVQGENAQLLLDLHAFEQQNDALVRQLEASDGQFRVTAAGKHVVEELLLSTKLAIGGLERSREVMQRDSATVSRQVASMRIQLEATSKERECLQQRLDLSQTHGQHLEAVAADLRTQTKRGHSVAPCVAKPAAASADVTVTECAGGVEGISGGEGDIGGCAAGLHADVSMLRQTVEMQGTELVQLTRALGTATFERDAAVRQQQQQATTLERLQETVASQLVVIKTLDDERAIHSLNGSSTRLVV
jgi:chromosome segregation ATPase